MRTTEIFHFSSMLNIVLAFGLLAGCSTAPPEIPEIDSAARDEAVFNCKQQVQAKKKARFQKLPRLLQRLAGDNQVLIESQSPLSKVQITRAIAKFPLIGDSGGRWIESKDAQMRTVSTRLVGAISQNDGEEIEIVSIIFGQPGRTFDFPLAKLRKPTVGLLKGDFQDDHLSIREIDEHHLLIEATSNTKSTKSHFHSPNQHALVRTYTEQSYLQESKSLLSDYPISLQALSDDTCDEASINPR